MRGATEVKFTYVRFNQSVYFIKIVETKPSKYEISNYKLLKLKYNFQQIIITKFRIVKF